MNKILVVYNTHEGHTKGMVEKLAAYLKQHQLPQSTIMSLDSLMTNPTQVHDYDAVIVGASIRFGKLPKKLHQFADEQAEYLNKVPSFLFVVNLTARKPGKDTPEGNVYTRKFLANTKWKPRLTGVFAGRLNYSILKFPQRHLIRFVMFITGGETDLKTDKVYTNWDKFTEYCKQLTQDIRYQFKNK